MIDLSKYKWAVYAICILACLIIFKSCYKPIPTPQIVEVKKVPASTETRKQISDAKSEIKVQKTKVPIGKKEEIKIVERQNGEVVQITTFKSDWGIYRGLGLLGSATLSNVDFGIGIGTLYYDRWTLDGLVGSKAAGAGISGLVFKNTALGIGYQYNYTNLLPTAGLYMKVGF